MNDETIYYLEMANGEVMRVPESKLKDFCLLDEKIKAKMQQKEKEITYMPNFDDAIRATEEMFAQEQIIQEKDEKIQRLMYDINVLRASNQQMHGRIEELSKKNEKNLAAENKMEKVQKYKKYTLVAVYVILIIIELFFCVPFNNIQTAISSQRVPHTTIIGSGYTTMADIGRSNESVKKNFNMHFGKTVNTPQIFLNVSITTIIFVMIYWLFMKNRTKKIDIYDLSDIPELDIDGLAFADKDTQKAEMDKYTKQLIEYIKRKDDI